MKISQKYLNRLIKESIETNSKSILNEAVVFYATPWLIKSAATAILGYVASKAYSNARTSSVVKTMEALRQVDVLENAADKIYRLSQQAEHCGDKELLRKLNNFVEIGKQIDAVYQTDIYPDMSDAAFGSVEAVMTMGILSRHVGPNLRSALLKGVQGAAIVGFGFDAVSTEMAISKFKRINFGKHSDDIEGFDRMYQQMHDVNGKFKGYLPCIAP